MIPVNEEIIDVEVIRETSFTYKFDFEADKISRYTDGLEAMEQFVFKALQTNRYDFEIYDWNYGFEFDDLIGKPITYAKAKLPGRIREALIHDDRVTAVDGFSFPEPDNSIYSQKKNTVCVSFTVHTIYGSINASKAVEI